MKVYRLERNGLGPWAQEVFETTRLMRDNILGEPPVLKKGDNRRHFLSAVDEPNKIKEYFKEAYYPLVEEGFEVKEYDVPQRRVRYSENNMELLFHPGSTEVAQMIGILAK
jgi:hypothetical protein